MSARTAEQAPFTKTAAAGVEGPRASCVRGRGKGVPQGGVRVSSFGLRLMGMALAVIGKSMVEETIFV